MCSLRLVALLACIAGTAALDSEGTNFVFAFVRNANPSITNQVLSATVINRNPQDCMFTLTFRPDYHRSTPPQNLTQNLVSMTSTNVAIPSWYGFNYTSDGPQDDVYTTLIASSSCPVTLLANNYDEITLQGDTYMVLPTTWGSKSFTFSLPPSAQLTTRQYEQVYILPVAPGAVNVKFTEIGNTASQFNLTLNYGNAPAVYVGARTADNRPRTYHVTSDAPVVIVAGVTCAGRDPSNCDHVAYMPYPQAADDCYSYDYYDDDHLSYLPTTSQFFTDIPGSCLVGQDITASFSDDTSRTITIKPQMESPLWSPARVGNNENGVAFHNGGSNIHIARYYDGTYLSTTGAFIATSPSITQFHNDYAAFHTFNANDSLEIFCTVLACSALTLDGKTFYTPQTVKTTQKVDGVSYFIFVIPVPTAGFHQLDLNPTNRGNYAFFVFGKNGKYSYGYGGGVNKPTVVLAPATTGTPGTGTQPTVTVPAVTTPTVTVPAVTTPTVTVPAVTTPTSPTPAATSPTTPGVNTGSPSTSKPPSSPTTITTVATQPPVTLSTLVSTSRITTATSAAIITSPTTQAPNTPIQTTVTIPTTVVTRTPNPSTTTLKTTPAPTPLPSSSPVPPSSASTTNMKTTSTPTPPPSSAPVTLSSAPTTPASTSQPSTTITPLKTTTLPGKTTVSTQPTPTTTIGNPSTSGTGPTNAPPTGSTSTPSPVATSVSTSAAPVQSSTSGAPVQSTTTVPIVTSPTTPSPSKPPVTTQSTAAPPVTTPSTPPTPTPTTKPTAPPVTNKATTQTLPTSTTPEASTQSASQFGVFLPVFLSLLFIFY